VLIYLLFDLIKYTSAGIDKSNKYD